MFKVIIAGGRDFSDYEFLKLTMDHLLSNITSEIGIVCGMAKGADLLGKRYANEKGYKVFCFPADWSSFGKSAGFVRNEEMAQNADALVAFWNGKSRGTQHMIKTAERYKLKIRVKNYIQMYLEVYDASSYEK